MSDGGVPGAATTTLLREVAGGLPGSAARGTLDRQLDPVLWAILASGDSGPLQHALPALRGADLRDAPRAAAIAAKVLADADPSARAEVTRLLDTADAAMAAAGDRQGLGAVAWIRGEVQLSSGDPIGAADAWRRAFDLAAPGRPAALVGLVQSLHAAHLAEGEVTAARAQMRDAARLSERAGARRAAALADAMAAALHGMAGDFDEADDAIARATAAFDAPDLVPGPTEVVLVWTTDAQLAVAAGDGARARAGYLRGLLVARGTPLAWLAAAVRTARADQLIDLDPPRAHDDARFAQRTLDALGIGNGLFAARARRARACAALASHEPLVARALVEPLLAGEVEGLGANRFERVRTLLVSASASLALGDRATAGHRAHDAALLAEEIGARFHQVRALLLRASAEPTRHAGDVRAARHLRGHGAAWDHLWSTWPRLQVEQLGTQRVLLDGVPAAFRTEAAHQLVHSLVLAGVAGLRSDELCERFWPGRAPAQAASSLSTTLGHVRASLGREAWRLERRAGVVRLDLTDLDVDYRAAREAVLTAGPAAAEAERALEAPLLPAWHAEPWVQECNTERERLLRLLVDPAAVGFTRP